MRIKQIEKVQTVEDLEALGIGNVQCEIGHRGGGLGFFGEDVAKAVGVNESYLSHKYGCGCNYLGGGVRGSIFVSGYDKAITGKKAQVLDAIAEACKRAYINGENEMGLNGDIDGETNWDAEATRRARESGVVSAY
jgi:hypothetical protein